MAKKTAVSLSFDDFVKKNFGENVLYSANSIVENPRNILKTTLSLDIALNGGIPDGTIGLISGKPKVGKTTISLEILKNAIDSGRPAYYVDIEKRCKKALLSTINGLDATKLNIISSTKGAILSAENWFQIIERCVKDNPNVVMVIDSLAMLSTLSEQTEAAGDNRDMGGVPKLMASFVRKMIPIIDSNNAILIFISQYQTNRDPRSMKKYEEKGGLSIQYACSVWINADYAKLWEKDPDSNAPLGHNVHLKILSSALGSPFLPCEVPIKFGKGVDRYRELALHCENLGIIEKSGAWYSMPGYETKWQGIENFCDFLRNDNAEFNKISDIVRKMVLNDT